MKTATGRLWSISAYACNPVFLSDGGLYDYEEIDLSMDVRAETAKGAHEAFMEWIENDDIQIVGELFIESIKQVV